MAAGAHHQLVGSGENIVKLLHTSDWHIGRDAATVSRTEDFDSVLREIVDIARKQKPDFILHSGDLFDVARPAVADMRTGIAALQALAAVAPVVVIAGNHDSPPLFRLFNLLGNGVSAGEHTAAGGRITFTDRARTTADGGILDLRTDSTPHRLRLATMPFVHANRFADIFRSPQTSTRDYADQLRLFQLDLANGLQDGYRQHDDVLVFAAHLYIEGALLSRSERRMDVTDSYASLASALPPVAYAALGHIHRPQDVPGVGFPCRYSGSPLQLDFGETGEQKSVVLVEVEPGRPAHVQTVDLHAGRPLKLVTGTLDQIAARAHDVGHAIVRVTVDTDTPTPHLGDRVRELLPEAAIVAVEENCSAVRVKVLDSASAAADDEPSLEEMFRDYLAAVGTPGARADHVLTSFATLLDAAAHSETEHDCGPLPEEQLLSAVLAGEPVPDGLREQILLRTATAAGPTSVTSTGVAGQATTADAGSAVVS